STALLFFDRTVDKFKAVQGGTGRELTPVSSGNPQTIMIAGSDRRHGDKKLGLKARSDTIILVRIAPGKGVSLMSLPRDLKVQIPGHGTDKLNVAYTLGGPKLSIRTVKQLTGLAINHYVDVSFHGFAEGVNALGCVYVDIDRRYFNDNSGAGFGQNFAVINVKPGYQKMCGQRALEYVRYRHTDNDIVRGARQQDFLRQVRDQVSASRLLGKTGKLIDIFADNTRSDIQSPGDLRRLLGIMLGVESKPIKQVKFHGRLGESYVTASPAQIKAATRQFLYLRPAKGPLNKQRKRSKTARKGRSGGAKANLVDFTVTSRGQGQIATDRVGFPVYYPRKLVKGSSYAEDAPRT
ncbi:MAG: LCP family protein, partial [Burkholderiales bacterium]